MLHWMSKFKNHEYRKKSLEIFNFSTGSDTQLSTLSDFLP